MKLQEYQGKQLFREYGIPVPEGKVAATAQEAAGAVKVLGGSAAVKAQVPVGGRGKAGLIKLVDSEAEAGTVAGSLLGAHHEGFTVMKLLVEEKMEIDMELFLSLVVDGRGKIVMLFSPSGGMEIETVAELEPEKMFSLEIDPCALPPLYRLRPFLRQGGLRGKILNELANVAFKLLKMFFDKDLLVAEINPLAVLSDGRVVAGDAKVEMDDNALYRQQWQETQEFDNPLEMEARNIGVTYYRLEGDIGIIASGAGLAMCTMDLLAEAGHNPANFLETGGGITEELMYRAVKLVCSHEKVRGLLVNLYGGVNPIEKGAAGIVRAINEMSPRPPLVVKALGNKQEECWRVLEEGGIPVVSSVRTEVAARRLVELMDGN
ncbi:MAG: acetate--CoA ligase family protein [Dethiobacter sp.]|jgi:succinyl-CoA synthetase beta subunit|nr:acetate--CoA ligase family protein [Dethiobacter sp.]